MELEPLRRWVRDALQPDAYEGVAAAVSEGRGSGGTVGCGSVVDDTLWGGERAAAGRVRGSGGGGERGGKGMSHVSRKVREGACGRGNAGGS